MALFTRADVKVVPTGGGLGADVSGVALAHLDDGGFASIIGPPGTGKSAALRLVQKRLSAQRDVVVGALTRPQGSVPDLYRELGHLFTVPLTPHNRWSCAKHLQTVAAAALSGPPRDVRESWSVIYDLT